MRKIYLFIVMVVCLMISTSVWADDNDWKNKKDDWSDFRVMMTERHKMTREIMAMTKETMVIIKNLNHKPSDSDKTRLDEMIKKLDEMMAHDKEISERMMKKWHHGNSGDGMMHDDRGM